MALPISTRSVLAARYPIRVGESKPYASGTQMVSNPACSSVAAWSAATRGLPAYVSWVESFTLPTVTEPRSPSQGTPGGRGSGRRGSAAETRQHVRAGDLAEQSAGHEQLGAAYAGADDGGGDVQARLVDQDAPSGRQADRSDAAVLHPRLGNRTVHRQERRLADV